jgi:anthranilate/para-aminobenzoate synthase component II
MKSKLLIAVLAITLSNQTLAAAIGYGVVDCGKWVNGQSKTPPNYNHRAWLAGFISGLNQDKWYEDALSKTSSADQIFLWMDNYCKKNPLKEVNNGAYELMQELKSK